MFVELKKLNSQMKVVFHLRSKVNLLVMSINKYDRRHTIICGNHSMRLLDSSAS